MTWVGVGMAYCIWHSKQHAVKDEQRIEYTNNNEGIIYLFIYLINDK